MEETKKNNTVAIVFSYKRPLQLSLLLNTLKLHCLDYNLLDVKVIYKTDIDREEKLYFNVFEENKSINMEFIKQYDFREDVSEAMIHYDFVMFLTDDSIFVEDFSIAEVVKTLKKEKNVLGFSLRLGLNTTYCYPLDHEQAIPAEIVPLRKDIILWDWNKAVLDFAYPIEVSSSLYRCSQIGLFLSFKWNTPGELEYLSDRMKQSFYNNHPLMACYKKSVAFADPINKLNVANQNRSGSDATMTVDALLEAFENGFRGNAQQFVGYTPKAAHEEVLIELVKNEL